VLPGQDVSVRFRVANVRDHPQDRAPVPSGVRVRAELIQSGRVLAQGGNPTAWPECRGEASAAGSFVQPCSPMLRKQLAAGARGVMRKPVPQQGRPQAADRNARTRKTPVVRGGRRCLSTSTYARTAPAPTALRCGRGLTPNRWPCVRNVGGGRGGASARCP
jgi:hypothetical protein